MQLTDATTGQSVSIPDGLIWTDEFEWSPVETNQSYSLTGALIIEQGTKQTGRPISLSCDDDMNWASRSVVETLRSWSSTAGRRMTLDIGGVSHPVMFASGNPITAKPVKNLPSFDSGDYFHLSLKLIEVVV